MTGGAKPSAATLQDWTGAADVFTVHTCTHIQTQARTAAECAVTQGEHLVFLSRLCTFARHVEKCHPSFRAHASQLQVAVQYNQTNKHAV